MTRLSEHASGGELAREFEQKLRQLRSQESSVENRGCVRCDNCTGCQESTFCKNSEALTRSHFCTDCTRCVDSSHCFRCELMTACHHSSHSVDCVRSAYIEHSEKLTDCTYCFGCIGLARKDYHILNEAYERGPYFELVAKLRKELSRGQP